MPATGKAAISLEEFDKSEKMAEVRKTIQEVAKTGVQTIFLVYEALGNSREAIYTSTLLRLNGYEVQHHPAGISVKL